MIFAIVQAPSSDVGRDDVCRHQNHPKLGGAAGCVVGERHAFRPRQKVWAEHSSLEQMLPARR